MSILTAKYSKKTSDRFSTPIKMLYGLVIAVIVRNIYALINNSDPVDLKNIFYIALTCLIISTMTAFISYYVPKIFRYNMSLVIFGLWVILGCLFLFAAFFYSSVIKYSLSTSAAVLILLILSFFLYSSDIFRKLNFPDNSAVESFAQPLVFPILFGLLCIISGVTLVVVPFLTLIGDNTISTFIAASFLHAGAYSVWFSLCLVLAHLD